MPFEIRCETDIAAPAERVWDALVDVAAYPAWNPLVRSFEGELREGAPVRACFEPLEGRRLRSTVTVTVVDRPRRFGWKGRFGADFLLRGEHVYTLEPTLEGVRLVNREVFEGFLVPLARPFLRRTADAHRRNSDALKARVEAMSGA